jgi:hypothetical protein
MKRSGRFSVLRRELESFRGAEAAAYGVTMATTDVRDLADVLRT